MFAQRFAQIVQCVTLRTFDNFHKESFAELWKTQKNYFHAKKLL